MDEPTPPGRHRADDDDLIPPLRSERTLVGTVIRWTARALPVVTTVGIAASRAGSVAWIGNTTIVLTIVVGIFWMWLADLAVHPAAAWRDGDDLVATAVWSERRRSLSGSQIVRFRGITRSGTAYGAVVVRRWRVPLVLLDPIGTGGRGALDRLTRGGGAGTLRAAVVEYLNGGVLFVVLLVGAFAVILTGVALAGGLP